MRKIFNVGIVTILTMWAASAFAFTSTGVVESVSTTKNEIRIRNGDAYQFPSDIDLSHIKPGQKVHVSWDSQNPTRLNISDNNSIWLLKATTIRTAN